MAEGTTPRFPPEIVMNDDDPKKGYVTLFLTIPGLKTKKESLFGKAVPKNGSPPQVDFEDESVCMSIKVDVMGKAAAYEYKKNMPEAINPDKCSYKVKDELVVLQISKASSDSWTAHQRHLMRKD